MQTSMIKMKKVGSSTQSKRSFAIMQTSMIKMKEVGSSTQSKQCYTPKKLENKKEKGKGLNTPSPILEVKSLIKDEDAVKFLELMKHS